MKKLKKDLIDEKYKYGLYQAQLNDIDNEKIRLRKLKENQQINFGDLVEDLVSIIFSEDISGK